jgi:prevent-host-death family protein
MFENRALLVRCSLAGAENAQAGANGRSARRPSAFPELLERVEHGKAIMITRHGSPVARLVPAHNTTTLEQRRKAIERIRALRQTLSFSGLKIKDLVEEGRP